MRLVLLILLSLTLGAAAQTPATQPAPGAEFEAFGVRIVAPAAWKRLPENVPNAIGRWGVLKPDSTTEFAAMVLVEFDPARSRSSEAAANELAKKLKGTVDPEAELGGGRACRVTADLGDAENPKPFEALVARQNDYIYVISATGTEAGIANTEALQEIRPGFKFTPIAAPLDDVEPRFEPLKVFDRFTVKPLAVLRPSPAQRTNVLQMRIFNYRRNRADLLMTMEVIGVTAGATLEAAGTEVAVRAGAKEKDLKWKELSDNPRRVISNIFRVGNKNLPIRIGLAQLSATQFAMINFGLPTPDEFDRAVYEDQCEKMLQTVELIQPTPATAP